MKDAFYIDVPDKITMARPPHYEIWVEDIAWQGKLFFSERFRHVVERFEAHGGKVVTFYFSNGVKILDE